MPESSPDIYAFDLSIITISTNQRPLVQACLEAIFQHPTQARFEMIVVDNASTDGTSAILQSQFPEVQIVRNQQRLGYAANNNQGMRHAMGRYFVILNPDVKVLPGAIDGLVRFMDDHARVGLAGPKLLNTDKSLQYSCRRFSRPMHLLVRGLHLDHMVRNAQFVREAVYMDWDHDSVRDVDYITGACMVVRRAMLAEVGGLDEGFLLYFEDQDWCYRAWQFGWRVTYVPDSVMIHDHQRASARGLLSKSTRTHMRSMLRFFCKHYLPSPFRVKSVGIAL
jgi:GT2 family glycosyltransferase